MDPVVITTAVLQILAQLPQDEALIEQIVGSFSQTDLAALTATLTAMQAKADAQHKAAQAL